MTARKLIAALVLVAAAVLAAPAGALAGKTQESIFQDDRQLMGSGDAVRESTLDELKGLGVDTIHALMLWERIAPSPTARRRPRLNMADPASYPAANWDAFDAMLRSATARGFDVILTLSTPIPRWASRCRSVPTRYYKTCKPDPRYFKLFAAAVGRRYSGSYRDENQGGGVLPAVRRWSFVNEPNQGGWLTPQYERKRGRYVPVAARTYRDLFRAGVDGLRKVGHRSDEFYIGETAPIGRTSGRYFTRPINPGLFFRELFCLDSRGRRLRGIAARDRGCTGYKRLLATGVTHHPYNRGGFGKPRQRTKRDEIQIGTMSRLTRVLNQGSRARRIRGSLPIFITEFGFQTNPPDSLAPSPGQAAGYINESDYIAFNNSRIRGVGQYVLVDEPNVQSFQTGLRFTDGAPKASYDAYRLPIYVVRSGSGVKVWGQVRPGGPGEAVIVQHNSGSGWDTVATPVVTNPQGYVAVKVSRSGGRWRLLWRTFSSREASVARR